MQDYNFALQQQRKDNEAKRRVRPGPTLPASSRSFVSELCLLPASFAQADEKRTVEAKLEEYRAETQARLADRVRSCQLPSDSYTAVSCQVHPEPESPV